MKLSIILSVLLVFSVFIVSRCYANPIENYIYEETVKSLWGLDQKACFPDSGLVSFQIIAVFTKIELDSLLKQINLRYPDPKDPYEWWNTNTLLVEGDTLLFGLKYDTDRRGMRIALVDSLGKIVSYSKNMKEWVWDQISFEGKTYANMDEHNRYDLSSPKHWNMQISSRGETFDTLPYEISFYGMVQALLDSKKMKPPTDVYTPNYFFTKDKSYYYDEKMKRLNILDKASKKLTTYNMPMNEPVMKAITTIPISPTDNLFFSCTQFSGIVGNFIVFNDFAGWTTILVNMKTNKAYAFTSATISNMLNIQGVDPNVSEESSDWSGYQAFVTENHIYYFMTTKNGDYYVVSGSL